MHASMSDRRTRHCTDGNCDGQLRVAIQPESGKRCDYDGAERRKGSKVIGLSIRRAILLTLHVTAGDKQTRATRQQLVQAVQHVTGDNVDVASLDQGCKGQNEVAQAVRQGIHRLLLKHTNEKSGFVLLSPRWVVELSFGKATRSADRHGTMNA